MTTKTKKYCINKQLHLWYNYITRKHILKGRICGICGVIELDVDKNNEPLTLKKKKERKTKK